jgi:hypothetical protein
MAPAAAGEIVSAGNNVMANELRERLPYDLFGRVALKLRRPPSSNSARGHPGRSCRSHNRVEGSARKVTALFDATFSEMLGA